MSQFLVVGTAIVSFCGFACGALRWMRLGESHSIDRRFRVSWFIGALALLLHTLAVFHLVHDWSHDAALATTARQTANVTGLNWGGGLWLNYLLVAWWPLDVCWCLSGAGCGSAGCRRCHRAFGWFLAFMWFNATVIFGGATRWIGVAVFGFLVWHGWQRRKVG